MIKSIRISSQKTTIGNREVLQATNSCRFLCSSEGSTVLQRWHSLERSWKTITMQRKETRETLWDKNTSEFPTRMAVKAYQVGLRDEEGVTK